MEGLQLWVWLKIIYFILAGMNKHLNKLFILSKMCETDQNRPKNDILNGISFLLDILRKLSVS